MSTPSAQIRPYDSTLPFKRVEFTTYDSTILRGNLYHSPNAEKQAPIVILVPAIGLLKEQYLENWLRHFLHAGYHVLTYDNRSFGDSDGFPRDNFNWTQQAEDFVDAVTYTHSLLEVNTSKIFGWGVAHAGGLLAMYVTLAIILFYLITNSRTELLLLTSVLQALLCSFHA
jgi:pimeloyl-ACP methyl ester carboxylesterase